MFHNRARVDYDFVTTRSCDREAPGESQAHGLTGVAGVVVRRTSRPAERSANVATPGSARHVSLGRNGMAVVSLFAALLSASGGVLGEPAPPKTSGPPPRHGRSVRVIDDSWTFATDPSGEGIARGWPKARPAVARPIAIPSLWTTQAAPGYSGAAWYWREIDLPGSWRGQTIRLRFEAASERAEAWMNGERLGEHRGGAVPFEFDVTKPMRIGATNLLAVRVDGSAERGAGLWQGVLLMAHDEAYIADVFPYGGPLGNLRAEIELNNTSDKSGDVLLDARILATDAPNAEIKKSGQILSLSPKRNVTTMLVNVPKKRLTPWSVDTPSLYFLDLAFHQDKDVLDTTETTFGFRDVAWSQGGVVVNGAAFVPRAVSPDLDRPVVIATESDRESARALLKRLKSAKVNLVYLKAPPPAMLALADEEGVMIVEGARAGLDPVDSEHEIAELILRDRSHPSVLAWDLRGQSEAAILRCRSLDPTRFLLLKTGSEMKLAAPHAEDQMPVPAPAGFVPP